MVDTLRIQKASLEAKKQEEKRLIEEEAKLLVEERQLRELEEERAIQHKKFLQQQQKYWALCCRFRNAIFNATITASVMPKNSPLLMLRSLFWCVHVTTDITFDHWYVFVQVQHVWFSEKYALVLFEVVNVVLWLPLFKDFFPIVFSQHCNLCRRLGSSCLKCLFIMLSVNVLTLSSAREKAAHKLLSFFCLLRVDVFPGLR